MRHRHRHDQGSSSRGSGSLCRSATASVSLINLRRFRDSGSTIDRRGGVIAAAVSHRRGEPALQPSPRIEPEWQLVRGLVGHDPYQEFVSERSRGKVGHGAETRDQRQQQDCRSVYVGARAGGIPPCTTEPRDK